MDWYQREVENLSHGQKIFEAADPLYRRIASSVLTELDAVIEDAPLLSTGEGQAFNIYQWASLFPGSGLKEIRSDIVDIISSKKAKGLIG